MKKKRCPVLSFKSRAEAWGESNQKLRSRGRSLLSRPFACISMNKVIYLVHQKKIDLLIKLFALSYEKKNVPDNCK